MVRMPEIMFSNGLLSASPMPTESSPNPVMTRPREASVTTTRNIRPPTTMVEIMTIRTTKIRMRGAIAVLASALLSARRATIAKNTKTTKMSKATVIRGACPAISGQSSRNDFVNASTNPSGDPSCNNNKLDRVGIPHEV